MGPHSKNDYMETIYLRYKKAKKRSTIWGQTLKREITLSISFLNLLSSSINASMLLAALLIAAQSGNRGTQSLFFSRDLL